MGTFLGTLVIITGIPMALAPLLQSRRILKARSALHVSQMLFWTIALGTLALTIDGVYEHDLFIAVSSGISCCANTFTALLVRRYSSVSKDEMVEMADYDTTV